MTDLIEEAVEGWQDTTEREATGSVGGHDIRLVKREYEEMQRGPTAWKVEVFVDGESPLATAKNKDLTAAEAQVEFEQLVEKHNLQEQV